MSRSIVLLDGGVGQEIFKRSDAEPSPMWSTHVMLDDPGLVQTVHADFIRAGARLITLNNYTATRQRLGRDASVELLKPIHDAAIAVAHAAKSECGIEDVRIAGCLPPLVASYKPGMSPCEDDCLNSFRELVALQKGGVEHFMVETASNIREGVAATRAAKETGLPCWTAFTLDDQKSGVLRSGESLEEASEKVIEAGADAVMVNCSMPETIEESLPILANLPVPTGAYANGFTSIAALNAGGTVESLSARSDLGPEAYAKWGLRCVDAGLQIIGGCCETGPEHIAALKSLLEDNGYKITSEI